MPDAHDTALDRLREFRSSWNDEDLIDEQSGLTARDLDAILAGPTHTLHEAATSGAPDQPVEWDGAGEGAL